ncbi:MAG: amidohydrolase family protein [Acidimicrobiales bacterium]|nr:amidohydrolase family protein [Acidimicrobiales bacterium]
MASRDLPFPVFDADNHMYETPAALTKHIAPEFDGVIDYVTLDDGKTKIRVKGEISEYIPNPTFEKVAAPGAQEEYFKNGNPEGKSRREIMGKAIESPPAFREPAPRLELMNEFGVDRALMWPTLASLVEERLRDDPLATHAVITALNRWMHETWTFNYEDRIFATPVITLPIVDKAIEELEWVLERGARVILVRPAPVPGFDGPRSFALPEFDPFWERVQEAGILVGMHASDSGYQRYTNEWEGVGSGEFKPFVGPSGFAAISAGTSRAIIDTVASAIGHGMLSRFPDIRIAPVENGSDWVRPLISSMEHAYKLNPHAFEEDPVEVFKRCVYVHPFHEDDPEGLADLIGVDNIIFGSDFPHPEGLADPLAGVDELQSFSTEDQAKIMGGNLARLMGVEEPAKVT